MTMARERKKRSAPKADVPIAPMIDVVFLMLIYFMVSATLQRQEADIAFQLPGVAEQDEPLEMPDEQIIEITGEGQVLVNEFAYDHPNAHRFTELAAMLTRFREASDANRVETVVTIAPDDQTLHHFIVRVMDACSLAGIRNVNFAFGDE